MQSCSKSAFQKLVSNPSWLHRAYLQINSTDLEPMNDNCAPITLVRDNHFVYSLGNFRYDIWNDVECTDCHYELREPYFSTAWKVQLSTHKNIFCVLSDWKKIISTHDNVIVITYGRPAFDSMKRAMRILRGSLVWKQLFDSFFFFFVFTLFTPSKAITPLRRKGLLGVKEYEKILEGGGTQS